MPLLRQAKLLDFRLISKHECIIPWQQTCQCQWHVCFWKKIKKFFCGYFWLQSSLIIEKEMDIFTLPKWCKQCWNCETWP